MTRCPRFVGGLFCAKPPQQGPVPAGLHFLLDSNGEVRYNKRGRKTDEVHEAHAKIDPPGSCASLGDHLCLTAFAVTVKPLADVVTDYTRSDRHKKTDESFHDTHLLLLPGFERQRSNYTKFDRKCQQDRGKRAETFWLAGRGTPPAKVRGPFLRG